MAIIHPFTHAAAATLHDSNDNSCVAFLVGSAGNLKVTTKDGDTVTLTGLTAGTIYLIACTVLWSTGSSASSIVKLS